MAVNSPEDYEQVKLLQEGNFSEVSLVRRKNDDAQFVIKKVNLTRILEPKYRQIAADEATTLCSLHHPNILRVHNHFCERNNLGNLFYHLAVENVGQWTLADEIEKMKKSSGFFSENHVLWWSNQLISALKYLHVRDILHRNVRPNNIYLVNNNRDIKLGEFGFVKHEENSFVPTVPDTACAMSYVSPEFLAGDHPFCKKCDLWAMGVVLYEIVSQKLPQNHNSPKLGFPLKTSNVYSKELLQFIRWTLSTDENNRPSVKDAASHNLMGESRVEQIRTLFGLPPPDDLKSMRTDDAELEPWQFHGRSSTIMATKPWISALLDVKGKDYLLATSYSGQVAAVTKTGDTVLWKTKITAEGARGGLWHACVDEKRGRLLVCYNGTDDPVNVYPVDIYSVPLDALEPKSKPQSQPPTPPVVESDQEVKTATPPKAPGTPTKPASPAATVPASPTTAPVAPPIIPPVAPAAEEQIPTVRADLFFHHDGWHCYGLRIDPAADLLYVCDWFENKIGIWPLEGLQPATAPVHVITKPEQFKHFNPTRLAFLPVPPKQPKVEGEDETVVSAEEPREQYIAVSDWLRSRIYLFKTTAIRQTINHEFEALITSKGEEIGLVATPIDLQYDKTVRTLIVCDQGNSRAQVFIPDPEWPKLKAIATENLGGHFSAVAITEAEPKANREDEAANIRAPTAHLRVLMAGLNTGEIATYKFKCA